MTHASVPSPYPKRRRFSREFKARIIARCLEPGASVSRISLDHGLNANMVRRWISEARRAGHMPAPPGFVPISLPAVRPAPEAPIVPDQRHIIRIEIPRAGGAVVVEWPVEQAHQCAVLLRALLE